MDRPGIVADVTEALAAARVEYRGLLDEQILQGQFSMVLVLDARDVADGRVIEAALAAVIEERDLFIAVRPVRRRRRSSPRIRH